MAALLDAPGRKPAQGVRTLLGGMALCRCGNPVIAGTNATGKQIYRCNPQTRGDRPGPHCQQMTASVDEWVSEVIIARLSRADLADLCAPRRPDLAPLHREAASIRRNLDEMAADRALGLVSREQMIAATERGNVRLAEIEARARRVRVHLRARPLRCRRGRAGRLGRPRRCPQARGDRRAQPRSSFTRPGAAPASSTRARWRSRGWRRRSERARGMGGQAGGALPAGPRHRPGYKDAADGTLFAPGLPLDGDQPRAVLCAKCGRSYQVDPRRLRRAIRERWRNLVVQS